MTQELDDLAFWLPSEFLTDDELVSEFKTDRVVTPKRHDFPYGFGHTFDFSSDLSSPVASVTGTTETGSDEDDFITELSRNLARSTLQDSSLSSDNATEGWKLPGSPQSTLCGFKPVAEGSPNSVSCACSLADAKDPLRWDLLDSAAAEVARIRMVEETAAFYSTNLFTPPPPNTTPVTVLQQNPTWASGFYSNQTQTQTRLSFHQFQSAHCEQMKQHQVTTNGVLGQEMRAVFPGAGKERVGTGVFMPRRFGSNPTETRKKPDAALKRRNNPMLAQQRRSAIH